MKDQLNRRDLLLGTWLTIPHTTVVEVVSQSHFDFVLIDGEHGPIPPHLLGGLLPLTERYQAQVCYRVPSHSSSNIKAALDAGVTTIMVPMVESVDQAKAIVSAAKYPPQGRRGIGPWRASNYYQDYENYCATANDKIAVILQIESAEGLSAAVDIAAVEGVDALFVGPADLAGNLGYPLGTTTSDFLDVCESVSRAAEVAGISAGIDIGDKDQLTIFVERGFSLFTYGQDSSHLMDATQNSAAEARAALTVARR